MLGSNLLASALLLAAAVEANSNRPENCTSAVETVTVHLTLNDGSRPAPTDGPKSTTTRIEGSTGQTGKIADSSADKSAASGSTAASAPVAPAPGTYRSVLYFTNWGTYGANHQPQDLQASQVTHLLYAFADIKPDGEVVSSDPWADTGKQYPTDVWGEKGTNAYGCIKQLFIHKKRNRQLKLLLSIGGWTWSPKFVSVAATEAGRRRFATSAVRLMGDWGFDGLDIDWEYPQNPTQAADFVKLLEACRRALDEYAASYARGYRFALTIAVPAGKSNYEKLDMRRMAPFVDGWHLMAYDYAGSWESTTGHQANLYRSRSNPAATKADTNSALSYYLAQGIDPRKIMLGMPLYGRSFMNTDGPGRSYRGLGKGSGEEGIWHYKALPISGAQEYWDAESGAAYSYDSRTREFVTYDTVRSGREKASYLVKQKLGGAVFWESAGDKKGEGSLVLNVARSMGQLDRSQNWLSYPASRYDNIRNGLPGA